jgi:hypothetical protein
VLALLLFAFIAYGATIEIVHKHNGLARSYDEAGSSIRDASSEGFAAGDSRQAGACLICQLHQHLSNTLFNAQPGLAPPPTLRTSAQSLTFSYLSQTDAPGRGRAPPLASQL